MREEKIVLLFCRENLTEINKTKLIGEIDMNCFEGYLKPIKQAGVLIFVEKDGSSKCLKHGQTSYINFKYEDLTDDYRVVKYHEKLERLF